MSPVLARRVAAGLLALLATAGCAAAGNGASGDGAAGDGLDEAGRSALASAPEPPADAELRAQAGLEACPDAPPPGGAARSPLPVEPLPCLGDGPAVSLAGLSGEPTLVNLWASWCRPCVEEMPALQAVDGDGLRVVGVLTQDRARQGLAAAAGLGVRFPSVVDERGAVLRALGLPGLPATLFVRPDGSVAHTHVGPALDEATARRLAAEHLGVAA